MLLGDFSFNNVSMVLVALFWVFSSSFKEDCSDLENESPEVHVEVDGEDETPASLGACG